MTKKMVGYEVGPEQAARNEELIRDMFAELRARLNGALGVEPEEGVRVREHQMLEGDAGLPGGVGGVDERQHWSVRLAQLDVEDLDRGRVAVGGAPR